MHTSTKSFKQHYKALQEMNLIDSFIFNASTENSSDAEFIAKLIIERSTGEKIDKITVSSEKSLTGIDLHNRGIRMDLYVESFENERLAKVYDIEPNNYNPKELPIRSRYNQSITDVKLLGAGEHFRNLPDYMSIWILPFDPFGQNRMLYTVKNSIENFPDVLYNDGVKKLFLYTDGILGGSEDLKNLLTYFSDSKKENATDTDLEHLHHIVENIRHNQKVGIRYMTLQDYIEMERDAYFRDIEDQLRKDLTVKITEEITQDLTPKITEEITQDLTPKITEEIKQELQAKALETARKNSITSLVRSLREFHIPEEQILDKIKSEYTLTTEDALLYLNI